MFSVNCGQFQSLRRLPATVEFLQNIEKSLLFLRGPLSDEIGNRTLPNRDRLLRPGMSGTAWLPVGDQGTLLAVPAAAVQRVRDRWCVFIPKDHRTFEIRPVGRGRDIAGEVEMLSGVRAGEPIVVDGAFLLKAETERSAAEGEHGDKPE